MSGAWITLDWQKDAAPVGTGYAAFRKEYDLTDSPVEALLSIAATPGYRLWINGSCAADSCVRSFSRNKMLDEVDVRPGCGKGRT